MTKRVADETAILIVDDEVSLRNTFRIFLQRAGYQTVIAVDSFKEAVMAVTARMFDLIICDIFLESDSGIDLLRRFKELGVTCPVVIVTGYPHFETASDALRLGAFDYLHKPVEKETLLRTARLAIQQYRLEQEKKEAEFAKESYRRFLETIFKSVSDSIVSIDHNLIILKMNEAASLLFREIGLDIQERSTLDVLRQHRALRHLVDMIAGVLQTGAEVTDHRVECPAQDKPQVLSVCISPLDNGTGETGGAVLVVRDITHKEQRQGRERSRFHRMIGASPAMQNVYVMIENIAPVDSSVLITGDSGTGKELVVHALHLESRRRNKPLVMVDCTAIPDNLLESELFGHKKGSFTGAEESRMGRILRADGGTLFLDEIGDISITMQLRLLRFLQEKTFSPVGSDREIQVDVRVVAATNVNLKEKVKAGEFREDLYFRLLIIDIDLPPLKNRPGDISLLTHHFIDVFSQKVGKNISGISAQALELLNRYNWPGNVRQLEHTIERACILCKNATISSKHLPREIVRDDMEQEDHFTAPQAPEPAIEVHLRQQHLSEAELQTCREILAALKTAGGNKAKAARILKIDRSTLYRKIREHHIDTDIFSK